MDTMSACKDLPNLRRLDLLLKAAALLDRFEQLSIALLQT